MTLTALVDDAGKPVGIATTERDITERNRAMQRLLFGNRALKALNHWYKTLTVPGETSSLAGEACRILVEQAGYRLAWIGKAAQQRAKTATPVQWSALDGSGSDPADDIRAIAETARSAVDRAVGSRRPVAVRSISTDPAHSGGRADALTYQYGAYLALPLLQDNRVLGILVIFASEAEAFEEQEVELLGTLSESLALALGPDWQQPGTPG